MKLASHAASKVLDIVPESIRALPAAEPLSQKMQIMVFVFVCFVTLHNSFNFLTLYLLTIDFKINNVFDFNISLTLCFLLMNYNGNEPNIS